MTHFVPPNSDLLAAGAAQATRTLRLLANENRLMILCHLGDGELSVGEIGAHIALGQSALSQHLALLRAEGAVATRRVGQTIYYRIADPAIGRIIATLADIYCPT